MPLIKSKSKKAFEHNIKAEMEAGKPQKQSIAIAYSMKKKAKKASGGTVESGSPTMNMAEGGSISASNERRPMPDNRYDDSAMASRNSSKKAPSQDSWTDTPTERQARANDSRAMKKIKHPKMVPSSVINARLRDQEDDLQDSAAPASPSEQPNSSYNEEDADRQGPAVPDMQREHSNHRKPYAKGGSINGEVSFESAEEDHDPNMSPIRESYMSPPEDEYMAGHFAEGGSIDHEMMDQPEEEEDIDHSASVASAIMARRRLARGGEIMEEADPILSHDSIYSDDSSQADLSRNADEDANEEDQLSFNALRKENYDESSALRQADHPMDSNMKSPEHDEMDVNDRSVVGSIRRKMKSKSPISR